MEAIAAATVSASRNPRGRTPGVMEKRPRLRATKRELAERLTRLSASQITSGEVTRVLEAIQSDRYWMTILAQLEAADDWRTIAELMKFWLQMRDGRPAQQINVNSVTVSFSATEVARAKAIANELRRGVNVTRRIANDAVTQPYALGEAGGESDGQGVER